jgi:ABC-2 type transport system ATP-binding protein
MVQTKETTMSEWAIETNGLGHRFGKKWAVRNLDLKVPTGSVLGLLGPNGAGKSTTLHMLMGLLPPNEGSALVAGHDPVADEVAVRQRVGYVAEKHGFYEWMTVSETIRLVAAYHQDWDDALRKNLQGEFGLDGVERVGELSKGMRARLALLLALSFDPDLLVLDEPTGGLDPAARRHFIETILGRYQETGKTILVSSHLLNEFAGLLDHVAFLRDGRLEMSLPLEELRTKVKQVKLIYEGGIPADLIVPGARSLKRSGREAVALFDNFDPTETPKALAGLGASRTVVQGLRLEDIFVEVVGS